MESVCAPTCHTCATSSTNEQSTCIVNTEDGTCQNPKDDEEPSVEWNGDPSNIMTKKWGVTQLVYGDETMKIIQEMEEYMTNEVMIKEEYESVRQSCKNKDEHCSYWAQIGKAKIRQCCEAKERSWKLYFLLAISILVAHCVGECEANPSYMLQFCGPSCQSCNFDPYETRCPFDKSAPLVWGPGDLDKMFQRITTDPTVQRQYTPTILSSPATGGPWLVQLENFVAPEECERLIYHGQQRGYESSLTLQTNPDGTVEDIPHPSRNSKTTWCLEECITDPLALTVIERIEKLTGIPRNNSEALQLLQYGPNQFYRTHHDYLEHHLERPQSVRIVTIFLYLNDVKVGGQTNFPRLNLTVSPKRGRAVMWPNVRNDDPIADDLRTEHESMDVKEGIKYGANAWLHHRDFMTPFGDGCTD